MRTQVLVTKSDLEEKAVQMAELRAKVDELQSQNDYQLRLKELAHTDKLQELSDKFSHELEADKRNYELLLQAKNDLELECARMTRPRARARLH